MAQLNTRQRGPSKSFSYPTLRPESLVLAAQVRDGDRGLSESSLLVSFSSPPICFQCPWLCPFCNLSFRTLKYQALKNTTDTSKVYFTELRIQQPIPALPLNSSDLNLAIPSKPHVEPELLTKCCCSGSCQWLKKAVGIWEVPLR